MAEMYYKHCRNILTTTTSGTNAPTNSAPAPHQCHKLPFENFTVT